MRMNTPTMNITSTQSMKLGNVLNVTDKESKLAAYAGIAVGFIENTEVGHLKNAEAVDMNGELKIAITNLVYSLNELAIIDKDLLKSTITNMIKFKVSLFNGTSSSASFKDVIGGQRYLGEGIETAVDANLDSFRTARKCIHGLFKETGE